ncbi:hypothetical protein ABW19_dt0201844 [Dactylella cylindrospora]|nr:hypothetical protein ABW19_dt0201844 [Dactylella cylindrospora]
MGALIRSSRSFETDIITLKIGDEKTYYVHKEALTSASAVLKKQLDSEMKEATSKEIVIKDSPGGGFAFNAFLQFCYFGGYGYDEQGKEDALLVHANVYALAERMEALKLKSLALRKATRLCSSASDKSTGLRKVLQFVLPDTIPVIYGNTYDINTGKLPYSLKESGAKKGSVSVPVITRDGFRVLLARFAGLYIEDLRKNESFLSVIEEYPAFAVDLILFTAKGKEISIDEEGNLKL